MIRKLRTRLVLASILSLFIVLLVIMGGLNLLNYRRIVNDADGVLEMLRENGGTFPQIGEDYNWPETGPRYRSRELPFEMRFFSVLFDRDGNVLETNTQKIAAIDAGRARSLALEVLYGGRDRGFLDIYRYRRCATDDGCVRLLFLDCGRSLTQFRNVLFRSALTSLIGLAAVSVLIILLSGRIIRPIARNYDKQKRFISDAGHEIRTPVTIIDADTEILEMDLGDNEWVSDIRQQTARLAELTNDLMLLSRMEEQEKVTMIDFPLSDVVNETAQSFQAPAKTQEKSLVCDVEPMLALHGSEKQIRQLVSILLDNALKYSDDLDTIRLTLKRQGRFVRLTVENRTQSLPREVLDNMFERFYRGDTSRSSGTKGYGIGLSIAKAVVTAHRGRIAAECDDGHTLRITVTLPAV